VTEDQFIFLASLMVALALVRVIWQSRKPAERTFRCAKCDAVTAHDERTTDAWRRGKVDFFCASCHAYWIAARNKHARPAASGCFGVAVAMVALPALLAWAAIAGFN